MGEVSGGGGETAPAPPTEESQAKSMLTVFLVLTGSTDFLWKNLMYNSCVYSVSIESILLLGVVKHMRLIAISIKYNLK